MVENLFMLKEKRIENPLCCKAASNSVFSALSARNKMEKEKILENLTAFQKANAKAYALSDIAPGIFSMSQDSLNECLT